MLQLENLRNYVSFSYQLGDLGGLAKILNILLHPIVGIIQRCNKSLIKIADLILTDDLARNFDVVRIIVALLAAFPCSIKTSRVSIF